MDIESQIGALSEAVELLQKSVSCSICLEIMVNPTRTKCGHSFCHHCIMTVVNTNRMATCPLCNSKITRRTVKENDKAQVMLERVLTLINSVGKDVGMDIIAHAKKPRSTQEALLKSPKVQRVLKQSKLAPKTVCGKSDPKCKNISEKQEAKEKTPKLISMRQETPTVPNEKEGTKENQRAKTPELVSVSQMLPLSPPKTDEKVSHGIHRTVEEVPQKKKVEEWLDKEFDTVASNIKPLETEDKEKSEQMTVVADVHKAEDEDLKSAPQQRVRCYKISKKKAMVFTDAEKITVDNQGEENNKKRKIENSDENELEAMVNAGSDPYTFIGSQKTPAKPTRKSSKHKNKENKSSSVGGKMEMQKKKAKTMTERPLPVRYNDSQTLSIDINNTFDKLVATAKKIEPSIPEEEHSDSDDTVFLFRTPLEDTSKEPYELDVKLNSLEGCGKKLDNKCNSKAGCQKRNRSKSVGSSKPTVNAETGSRNTKQLSEELKANVPTPLSPSKKINHTINGVSLAGGAIKNIPAVKSLMLDDAAKEQMQVLEKENLSDIIESATPVNVSKLNVTQGTKSPGWSRISKSKKEFDKLKKRERAALNVSVTKRNKITDCFKKVSSDTLVIPPVEDAVDTPISAIKPVADDTPKVKNLDSTEIVEDKQPQKTLEGSNFPKADVSLSKQKSFSDTFSEVGLLDSPASNKRKRDIISLIAILDSQEEVSKVSETTTHKHPEGMKHGQNELELKEETGQLQKHGAKLNTESKQETGANGERGAPSETKISLKNEDEAKKNSLIPTFKAAKVDKLSCSIETMPKQTGNELQTSKHLDSCIPKNAEECREKKRYVTFVKRGRFNHLTKHTSFILLGRLAPVRGNYTKMTEESQLDSQKSKAVAPVEPPINACIQTSPTLMVAPTPEKHTLEFVGCKDSQICNFVASSCDTIHFKNIIPLPCKKSVEVLKEDATLLSSSQADDIPTQEFHPPPAKKHNSLDKTHKKEKKSVSDIGAKMTLSQFSNATTVKYYRSDGSSLENSPESSNYSPDRSLTLVEVNNPDENKDSEVAQPERLSNEVLSGNSSDIRVPFRSTVNRRLNFVPQLTDPALDASVKIEKNETKKQFKRIRSASSSDSDSDTLVPEISDLHNSGGKRVKRVEHDDIEVVNLLSSQENNTLSREEPENELNSAELMARVMANIDADLAVKRSCTSSDGDDSEMEEDRNTPTMFTPTEYFRSQIVNSCSTDFHPNSAASSEAIIMGTQQQETQFEVKPKTPAGKTGEVRENILSQGPSATNKTSDADTESDDGIVHPTPNKHGSTNSRITRTSLGLSELRTRSIAMLHDVLNEPENVEKHLETIMEMPSSVQSHKTDTRPSLFNPLTHRVTDSVAVEKTNTIKELKGSTPKTTTETAQVEKSGFNERPTEDFQTAPKTARSTCKTPEVPVKKPCFVCSGLLPAMIGQVKLLANMMNADFSNTFTPNTTHLILKDAEDNLAYKTLKYLYAVVKKTWVVSFSWVNDSIRSHTLLPEDGYEMLDSSGENGPYRARNSTHLLLTNFEFYCIEPYTDITKEQLEELLKESGASVVNSVADIKFKSGTHTMILVQMDAKTEEEVQEWWEKYRVITVAHEWVLDSIGRYRVIPIWPYLMTDVEVDYLEALGYPDELLAADELEPDSQA